MNIVILKTDDNVSVVGIVILINVALLVNEQLRIVNVSLFVDYQIHVNMIKKEMLLNIENVNIILQI